MPYRGTPLTPEQIASIDTTRVHNGYPSFEDRLRIDPEELAVTALGDLVIPDGPWSVNAHPNRTAAQRSRRHLVEPLEPRASLVTQWERMGLELDTQGRPIHPYGRALLGSEIGVATGPGFYWKYGPNATTNLVASRDRNGGEVEFLVTQRTDGRQGWGLPGTFVGIGESRAYAALRGLEEKLGMPRQMLGRLATIGEPVISLANTRDTLHAWGEDTAVTPLSEPFGVGWHDVTLRPNSSEVLGYAWHTEDELQRMVDEGVFSQGHLRFVNLSKSPANLTEA